MALTITKPNPNAKLMAMIRNLHKQGLLDSPSYRQTLKDEAAKLRISDEELEWLIVEEKGEVPQKPSTVDKTVQTTSETKTETKTEKHSETKKVTEPTDSEKEKKKNYTPYIIAGAMVLIAVACLLFLHWWKEPGPTPSDVHPRDTVTPVDTPSIDPRLKQLIQDGEDVFKTKNVARAKRLFKDALMGFPDNQELLSRIAKCDEILKRSDYQSLKQVHENGKLGFADKDGYIVVDFLYDMYIERKSDMMILQDGDKLGVVGGAVKDYTATKYIERNWVQAESSYRMVKNSTGDCDFVKIENGKLIINEY